MTKLKTGEEKNLDYTYTKHHTEHYLREDKRMTQLLEKAFAEAAKLPPQEQDVIAEHVLEEMTLLESLLLENEDKKDRLH